MGQQEVSRHAMPILPQEKEMEVLAVRFYGHSHVYERKLAMEFPTTKSL